MLPLSTTTIRAAFVNASRKVVSDITLPSGFAELDWAEMDYLGWIDPKMKRRSYVVVPVDGEPVGIVLRQADASPRRRAQCSWCRDVKLPNDVVLYSAQRAGAAGRNGNTIGTWICAEFQCSVNVRKLPSVAYVGFDVGAARRDRIDMLRERSAGFIVEVLAAG
ncbi:FBP domain-containing protein [Cryobacterium adonitolivorans]|uniref:FBP domain-containing protein n=1 Tax=Cryobacterium adonitolivorans TaxID=1259189 RepID=A0A4R8W7D2_9MICO|nr:FBP domain-containing protein [Cryobacterium adonitolivorans]TFC04075.1 FBP domain-containing protein [Cryobacterium adonitolivorans]